MANTLLTPSIIAKEALMVLQSNLVMANLVHRDYSDEFVEVGDTITVRKPASFVAKNFTGTVSSQDITESSISVKMDRFRDVTVNVTSKQLTLDIRNFSEQVVTPAMQAIAQSIDSDLIAVTHAQSGTNITGTASSLTDVSSMAKSFDVNKVPVANRRFVMHPTHKYRYINTDNLLKSSYAASDSALRKAETGGLFGFDTYMSQNCPSLPSTTGSATAYKVAGTAGESTVALSALSAATATVKKGDSFILDGYRYTFTADGTGVSSAIASIAIDQPLHKTFTATDAKLITGDTSVAFHRNGIALVTRNLALPMGNKNSYIASADGLGVRVVMDYDSSTKKDNISFDIIYGIKELDNDMLGSVVG